MREQFAFFLIWTELALQSILLLLIIRNLVRYVCGQKKYREFHIAWFYALALSLISLRITEHVLVLLMNLTDSLFHAFIYQAWVVQYGAR